MAKVVRLDRAPMTELRQYGSEVDDESAFAGTVAITTRDHVNAATTVALTHTDWGFREGKAIHLEITQGNLLPLQRNEAVQKMVGDWIVFIDDDMVWSPKQLGQLVDSAQELDADILGGLCFRRSPPHEPTMFYREFQDDGGYNYLERWDSDIVEVDATGMAFCFINRRVFEKLAGVPFPPYSKRRSGIPPSFFRWNGIRGEDLQFCQDAKSVGCRIFVDTRIEIGHISEIEVRTKHYLLEVAQRPSEVEEGRRRLNDSMAMPTLTRAEALEKLGW